MAIRVLIVAGGTGGHIFPALAFGKWLAGRGDVERVRYVSGSRALEAEIYEACGVEPYRLPLAGSPLGSPSLFQNLRRVGGLFSAFWGTVGIFRKERPDVCFVFGGYVSLIPLLYARLSGVPVIAHEQNAQAGKVSRLASRLGVRVASGWEDCKGLARSYVHSGIPVRPIAEMTREAALGALGLAELPADARVIGLIGGSLSSASLEALVEGLVERQGEKSVFVVLGEAKGKAIPGVYFVGKQWDMNPFYSLCDGVVCRAGASTLAEVAAYGIPALAIPWMGAADSHQEANARCFAELTANPFWIEGSSESLNDAFERFLQRCAFKERTKKEWSPNRASAALWELGLTCFSR